MEFVRTIIATMGPFGSIAVLAVAVFFMIFFGFSVRRGVKISAAVLAAVFHILSIITGFFYARNGGSGSNLLAGQGGIEFVLSTMVIFMSLNLLLSFSMNNMDDPAFIRILILLVFSTIIANVFIVSRDFIMLFASFTLFIFMVFQLISVLNLKNTVACGKINKFGVRLLAIPAFLFFAFSLIYIRADIRNLSQVQGQDLFSNPFIVTGCIIMVISIGLYLCLPPFQGSYLGLIKKIEGYSIGVIWLLYLPLGIAAVIKLSPFIYSLPAGRYDLAGIIFMVFALFGFIASGAAASGTASLRRILSFMALFYVSFILMNLALFYLNIVELELASLLNTGVLIPFIFNFLPWYMLMVFLEKHLKSDSIGNLRGLGRTNIWISVSLTINLAFWLSTAYFMFPFYRFLGEGNFPALPVAGKILLAGYFISVIFLGINIARIIRELFKAPLQDLRPGKFFIPVFYHIYLGFFMVVILALLILVLIGKIEITGSKIIFWKMVIGLF
ncbi:MAG: hypothetical protein JW770_03235 [Actinobacteria bacterium]|nr:hypothetical protein [Actinomycetota bacterium]